MPIGLFERSFFDSSGLYSSLTAGGFIIRDDDLVPIICFLDEKFLQSPTLDSLVDSHSSSVTYLYYSLNRLVSTSSLLLCITYIFLPVFCGFI